VGDTALFIANHTSKVAHTKFSQKKFLRIDGHIDNAVTEFESVRRRCKG